MRLDDLQYKRLVTGTYKKMLAINKLSPLLAGSTPANIKRECMNVYQERYAKKDDPALRGFFGPAEPGRRFLAAIQDFDTDKFRPLDSYFKSAGKKSINHINLELLAWLMDFKHRPYALGMQVQLSEEEMDLLEQEEITTPLPTPDDTLQGGQENPLIPSDETDQVAVRNIEEAPDTSDTASSEGWIKKNYKKVIGIFLVLVCTGGIYAIWQWSQDKPMKMGDSLTGCMYWEKDHYEQVPCNEERKGRFFVPFNEEEWKNFKRITREDTITGRSIGIVHYLRIGGGREYYSKGGHHPVEVTRKLLPLSLHIFEKYLSKKNPAAKDSLSGQNPGLTSNP